MQRARPEPWTSYVAIPLAIVLAGLLFAFVMSDRAAVRREVEERAAAWMR